MKKAKIFNVLIFSICTFLFAVSLSFAAVPGTLNYQGTLTNNNGELINGTVTSITFRIYDQPTGGNLIWGPETHNNVVVTNGLFSCVLGETVSVNAGHFSGGDRYISIQVENDSEMSPRQKINSVPFALQGIPNGVIAMWSGTVNNIPSGWALCNGQNGTPDLRDKFIVGASGSLPATGGEATHILTANEMPVHTHTQYAHNHGASSENKSITHTHTDLGHNHAQDPHTHTVGYTTGGGMDLLPEKTGNPTHSTNNTSTVTATNQPAAAQIQDHTGSHSHGITVDIATATNQNTGGGAAHNNLPPYFALAFIMKL